MTKPRLLDLFCGAGGAGMGYHLAGFEVVGVDIKRQPRYPFEFHQADALTFPLDGFDVIHASPPCQAYSAIAASNSNRHTYPDLVAPVRERLHTSGSLWCIENVAGSPLKALIRLCGSMFGLEANGRQVYRHRYFETSWAGFALLPPCDHQAPAMRVYGGGGDGLTSDRRIAMGIDWMTRDELSQAIPPAYTRFIGEQALRILQLGKEHVA